MNKQQTTDIKKSRKGDNFRNKITLAQQEIEKELSKKQHISQAIKKDKDTRDIAKTVSQIKQLVKGVQQKYKNKDTMWQPVLEKAVTKKQPTNIINSHDLKVVRERVQSVSLEEIKEMESALLKFQESQWVHAQRLCQDISDMQFIANGIAVKSHLYDTWPVNALHLIRSSKHLFKEIFCQGLDDNYHAFRFYLSNSQLKTVLTDSCIPVTPTFKSSFSYIQDNQIWLPILLKAYAVFLGGIDRLQQVSFSQSVFNFTGRIPDVICFSESRKLSAELLEKLKYISELGCPIGLANTQGGGNQNEMFSVKEIGQTVIKLQSPFQVGFRIYNYNQIHQKFNKLIIISDFPYQSCCLSTYITFNALGLITATSTQPITKALQINFLLKESTSLLINMINLNIATHQYGFYIFELKQKQLKVSTLNMQKLRCHTRFGQGSLRGCCSRVDLSKGRYSLVFFGNKFQFKNQYQIQFYLQKKKSLVFQKMTFTQTTQAGERPQLCKPNVKEVDWTFRPRFLRNLILQDQQPLRLGRSLIKVQAEQCRVRRQANRRRQTQESELYQQQLLQQVFDNSQSVQRSECFDLGGMNLGSHIIEIMKALVLEPSIVSLNLSENNLSDQQLVQICLMIEQQAHYEMRQFNVQKNQIGVVGRRSLRVLKQRFKDLTVYQ